MKVVSIKRIARDNHIKSKKLRSFALKLASMGRIKIYSDVKQSRVYISKPTDHSTAILDLAVLGCSHAKDILRKGSAELHRADGGFIKESGLFNYVRCDPYCAHAWVFEKPVTVTKVGLYLPEVYIEPIIQMFLHKEYE